MIRFLYDDRWRFGICTASSSQLGYSPDSTRNPLREFPWRSGTGSTDQYIYVDTGGSGAANFVAIANPVIIGMSGNLILQSSNDAVTWTNRVTLITSASPRTRVWTGFFTLVSARYYRVYWQRVTGTGYVEFGTIRVGTYFEPKYAPNLPLNLQRNDLSRITKGGSGAINRSRQNKQYSFDLNFVSMPQTDVDQFDTMYETVGIGSSFFMVLDDPANLEETFYMHFTAPMQKEPIVAGEWDVKLSCEESL